MKTTNTKAHCFLTAIAIITLAICPSCQVQEQQSMWPKQIKEINYLSSADSTLQPALFYKPKRSKVPIPLLVGLHTWSGQYKQNLSIPYAKWSIEKDWVFIHPHFRGPNRTTQAPGSELVIADIVSAVEHAKSKANIDSSRIYLIGVSGGGYTSLLMAARAPHIWAGVSSWFPLIDLEAWYRECRALNCSHANDIVKSCGGEPGVDSAVDLEYKKRSPITYLDQSLDIPLDINAGIRDGHHSGGVPISHSLIAFNLVADEKDRISDEDIRYFNEKAEVPLHLKQDLTDPVYGIKQPLFRRTSGDARITIFDGGHEIVYEAALTWLSKQTK